MLFSLVHISDLHFKNNHPSLHRLHLLRDDILTQASSGPFYILFSGDLAYAGDDDLYGILLDEFFDPLTDHASGLYLTPGNHDIQHQEASAIQCEELYADKDLTYLYHDDGLPKLQNPFSLADPLSNYFALEDLISASQEANFFGSVGNNPHFLNTIVKFRLAFI